MTSVAAERHRVRRPGFRAGLGWLATAARRHRRSAGAISVVALGTAVPFALIGAGLDSALDLDTGSGNVGLLALFATILVADVAFIVFGSTLLSGLLDQYLQALGDQREDPRPGAIGRALRVALGQVSLVRLLVADFLVTTIIIVGLFLFIIPGLIAGLLLWLTGPIVSMEHLGAIAAMRRSVSLSLRGPVAVAVALVLPAMIWLIVSAAIDSAPFGNWWGLVVSGLIYSPFAALARVVAAQSLIAREAPAHR
jgi:hypothetical protein